MWDPISFRRRPRAPGTSLGERNGPTIQAFKTKALQFASLPPLSTPACGCGEGRKACRPKSHRFIGLYGWPISFPKGGCQELWAPFERKDPLACALKPPPGTELGRCLRDEAVVAWCPGLAAFGGNAKNIRFLKMCSFVALVPQASKKHLAKKHFGIPSVYRVDRFWPGSIDQILRGFISSVAFGLQTHVGSWLVRCPLKAMRTLPRISLSFSGMLSRKASSRPPAARKRQSVWCR
jgi:hypothetical protein